jgi:hypothetical protein
MLATEVLTYKDAMADLLIADELRRKGHWIIAYVEPSMLWSLRVQKIVYRGTEFWIIPITKDAYPAIAVRERGASSQELRERISRFLSVLAWVSGSGKTGRPGQ